jgi:hypothetical protein
MIINKKRNKEFKVDIKKMISYMINQEINSKKRRKLKAVEYKINFKEKIEEFMLKVTAK